MLRFMWLTAAIAGLASCGDNTTATPDAPPVEPDAPPAFTLPTPFAVPLSSAGPDQLQSAVAAPEG